MNGTHCKVPNYYDIPLSTEYPLCDLVPARVMKTVSLAL